MPHVTAILRVRNEAEIIDDTLDHVAEHADKIVMLDDASTDETVHHILDHPSDPVLLRNETLHPDRMWAETLDRAKLDSYVRNRSESTEWILSIDADERLDPPPGGYDFSGRGPIRSRLFDFYITAEDQGLRYNERRWVGPEYRSIIFFYRPTIAQPFIGPAQREPVGCHGKPTLQGDVRHYGKAISIAEWEAKCDHYSTWPEPYGHKWRDRRGKAIHTHSDQGRPLCLWDERDQFATPI